LQANLAATEQKQADTDEQCRLTYLDLEQYLELQLAQNVALATKAEAEAVRAKLEADLVEQQASFEARLEQLRSDVCTQADAKQAEIDWQRQALEELEEEKEELSSMYYGKDVALLNETYAHAEELAKLKSESANALEKIGAADTTFLR
ncbi:hypothetical protein B0A55_09022, partial [Friedmanniomyces simplex]